MKYYDRKRKVILNEIEYGVDQLRFLYNTTFGRVLLKLIFARPWFNKLMSMYYRSKFSRRKLAPYIAKYKVNMGRQTIADFNTFADFFTRKHDEIVVSNDCDELIAVADSKFSYYHIEPDLTMKIKNSTYTISELIDNKRLAKQFEGGTCLIFRLTVADNHRYIYPDSGTRVATRPIKGELHAIHPLSEEHRVYAHNSREFHLLDMDNWGRVGWIEVGALLVGKIHNHDINQFERGDEKGYFEFGGSTIIILLNKDVVFDDDIVNANSQGIETNVKVGERIGVLIAANKTNTTHSSDIKETN